MSILSRGRICFEMGELNEAAECFLRLTQMEPENPSNWLTHGFILFQQRKYTDAVSSLQESHRLDKYSPDAAFYLAESLRITGRYEESLPVYQTLLPHGERLPQAIYGYALCLLSSGRLADGFDAFEFRKACQHGTWNTHLLPDWEGEDAANKTVVAFAEGSISEQIMFGSVIENMLQKVGTPIIECDESLHSLFRRSFPNACIAPLPETDVDENTVFAGIKPKTRKEEFFSTKLDAQIALGSLPRLFRRSVKDFPIKHSFLVPDAEKVKKWESRLRGFDNVLKVGFLWQGNWSDEPLEERSIPVETLRGLIKPSAAVNQSEDDVLSLRQNNVFWFCLQNGTPQLEYEKIKRSWNVQNAALFKEIFQRDLDEMAAFISALDLVITPPGYVAHLAGALGVPTWVLLPKTCDWRWQIGGTRSAWASSVRLFRQGTRDSWRGFMRKMESVLEYYLSRYLETPASFDESVVDEFELETSELMFV